MCGSCRSIKLGFADGDFPPGTHICQIIGDDEARIGALMSYLMAGVENGEMTACFSEELDRQALERQFSANNISVTDTCDSGALTLAGAKEVYFEENLFDPDRMLDKLKMFYEDAVRQGYPAARVIGEMLPEIKTVAGGSRLLEYESRVSLLLREYPVTAVCQYDARQFDGQTILEVLSVHPITYIRGQLVKNPYYIEPEVCLETIRNHDRLWS